LYFKFTLWYSKNVGIFNDSGFLIEVNKFSDGVLLIYNARSNKDFRGYFSVEDNCVLLSNKIGYFPVNFRHCGDGYNIKSRIEIKFGFGARPEI
jgi:hypothetical protein